MGAGLGTSAGWKNAAHDVQVAVSINPGSMSWVSL